MSHDDDKCQKMMGRGGEEGCGTRTTCTVSRVCVSSSTSPSVDLFDQARKAVTLRCPFEAEEVNVARVCTLPVGLAESLLKHSSSHSRKRHKKSGKSDSQAQQQPRNVWVDTEDYFRQVEVKDIDVLYENSSYKDLATQLCFVIPSLKTTVPQNVPPPGSTTTATEIKIKTETETETETVGLEEVPQATVSDQQNVAIEPRQEAGQDPPLSETRNSLPLKSSGGSEWILGSRNKILLTSERPSKKRKLLGSDAGLERIRVERPSEGQVQTLCHVCCMGELGDQSNQLLVCDSCKVAVHQRCYGVQELPDGLWLCSWCQYCGEIGSELSSTTPCLLCPRMRGALKPLAKDAVERKSSGTARFIHLFCSQWLPELYVEDTQKMEPIMNAGGIKETRKKLVCNICKVKYGACVRCSHGTCRTSFHPICAREARHRMEIWGEMGSDTVELRAFCSKHSNFQDTNTQQSNTHSSLPVDFETSVNKKIQVKLLVNGPNKLKIARKNGDNSLFVIPTTDAISNRSGNSEVSSEQDTTVTLSNSRPDSESHDAQSSVSMEMPDGVNQKKSPEGNNNGNTNSSDSLDFVQVLKKLVDRGKASLKDVAVEIGISFDLLAKILEGDQSSISPDIHCGIVKWLRKHAYMGSSQSGSNSLLSFRARVAGGDGPDAVAAGNANPDAAPFKLIPPKKPVPSLRITKDKKVIVSSKGTDVQLKENGVGLGEVDVQPLEPSVDTKENANGNGSECLEGNSCVKDKFDEEKVPSAPSGNGDLVSSVAQSVRHKVELANGSLSESAQANVDKSEKVGLTNLNGEHQVSFIDGATLSVPNLLTQGSASCSYIHPFIQERLVHVQNSVAVKQEDTDLNGLNERDCCSSNNNCTSLCVDPNQSSSPPLKMDGLVEAKRLGILDQSPEDDVEGELVYFQNKLIDHAVASRRNFDDLILRVTKALPQEHDADRRIQWDSVLVNQYMSGVREARKQGRKERRHREAQAVLATATAAAAASSRISSLRKDSQDEVAHQELSAAGGRTATYSQRIPRAKETLSRPAVPKASAEKPFDIFQLKSFLNEHQRLCDVCRSPETMLNRIYICCKCKVPVHFGCYRGGKDHSGPWYCELCEDQLPFRNPGSLQLHSLDKSSVSAQCCLCGGTTGAFRKSIDGRWVHAFCAEWLLEATFRRGQPNLVDGMETVLKGRELRCVCCQKFGFCVKCNYGNCQSTFHPVCARNAGFYMHVKTGGGKLHHKAYCDKHSSEQREKAEIQQRGPDDLKVAKQIRVELERLRLLCERIIKREKVKRELTICSHEILASKRDSVAYSVLVRSPFFLPDVSSESATTSLRGHVDDNKSCSELMQRSDDITVDSAVSGKRRIRPPIPMDVDPKTEDSSTSQHLDTKNPPDRLPFSGKQLPNRSPSVASRNLADDEEERLKARKHTETFQKELMMTSDQASVQNQRLPKGFVYVPVVRLPKDKPSLCERDSPESLEPDG